MSDLLFSVRCKRKIRSAQIRNGVVMVDLGLNLGFRLWTELPEETFKLVADNKRKLRDQGRGDYTLQDGRNVCKHIIGREAMIRFTGRDVGDRVWRDAEFLSLL